MNNRFEIIDLKKYFNHKVVYNPKKEIIKGLGGDAYNKIGFFEFDKISLSETKIPFMFSKADNADNITCESQEILMPKKKFVTIHIAGFMHWGEKFDYIKCKYADDTVESLKFCFFDWTNNIIENGHLDRLLKCYDYVKILRRCASCCSTQHGYKGPLFVYNLACSLNSEKELTSIVLPDNMFAHIFAITLER